MRQLTRMALAASAAAVVGGCGRTERADTATDTTALEAGAPTDGGMQGMPGMAGMQMDTGMSAMMQEMHAHMSMMDTAGAQMMQSMLPQHRQMAANMLAQFDRDMRQMNMAGDASWKALADSIRADLTRIPEMGANELKTFMPRHGARLMRLMEMHRSMMRQNRPL